MMYIKYDCFNYIIIFLKCTLTSTQKLSECYPEEFEDRALDILQYIEDIYSFAVNTINIFIECNENISIFTREARVKI